MIPVLIAGARVIGAGLARGGAALFEGGAAAARGGAAAGRAAGAGELRGAAALLGPEAELAEQVFEILCQFVVDEANAAATRIYEDAKKHTPEGKGDGPHMKDLWVLQLMEQIEDQAIVENTSEHNVYVEFDTNKTRGKFMLTNARAKEAK